MTDQVAINQTETELFLSVSGRLYVASQQLSGQAQIWYGRAGSASGIQWASTDVSVATVSSTGVVSAVGAGTCRIIITDGTNVDERVVTVTLGSSAAAANTVQITPTSGVITATSAPLQLAATVLDINNNVVSTPVNWVSSNPTAITVDTTGRCVALKASASATITASVAGNPTILATAAITTAAAAASSVVISPATASIPNSTTTVPLTGQVLDQFQNPMVGQTLVWASSVPSVISVNGSGVVSGTVANTTAIISATLSGSTLAGTASVSTAPAIPTTVTLNTHSASIPNAVTKVTLTATTTDQFGNPMANQTYIWTSSATSVATVDAFGNVTGVTGGGAASIIATNNGASDECVVTTATAVAVSVTVSPTTATIVNGATPVTLTAVTTDQFNNVLSGQSYTWTSSAPSIAAVTGGVVTGLIGGGSTTITAANGALSGTAAVKTAASAPTTVTVTPSASTLISKTATQQLSASTTDQFGNVLTNQSYTWASTNPSAISISPSGLLTGLVANSTTQITATNGTAVGHASASTALATANQLNVSPASVVIASAAQPVTVTATTLDQFGNMMTGQTYGWLTSNAAVATAANGVITGVSAGGSCTVTVSNGSITQTVAVTTAAAAPASITMSPSSSTITSKASTLTITPTTYDQFGVVMTGQTYTWSTSNALVATVAGGIVTGQSASGSASITASNGAAVGTTTITTSASSATSVQVTPATNTITSKAVPVQLTAATLDQFGNAMSGQTITWSSDTTSVATVSSSGLVTGQSASGSATITATNGGLHGTASVTTAAAAPGTVTVSPSSATITSAAATQALTASTTDQFGNAMNGRTYTWSSSATPVATVSTSGVVTGVSASGAATITATDSGKSGTCAITTSAPTLTQVTLAPATLTIASKAATQQLTPTSLDQFGKAMTGQSYTYTSTNTAAVTVSNTGLVTGLLANGTATVTVSNGGFSASSAVTCTGAIATTVTVAPATATLTGAGSTQQFTATTQDQYGNNMSGRTYAWASGNVTYVTVGSTTGLATWASAGGSSIAITATDSSIVGTATVTTNASAGTIASVVVNPSVFAVNAIAPLTIGATAYNASNNPVSTSFVWSSSNPAIATVNSSGVVSVVSPGTVTITATAGGVQGSATCTACAAPAIYWDFHDGTMGPFASDPTFNNGILVYQTNHNAINGTYEIGRSVNTDTQNDGDQQFNADLSVATATPCGIMYYRQPSGFPNNNYNAGVTFGINKMIRFRQGGYNLLQGTLVINGGNLQAVFDFDANNGQYASLNLSTWPGDNGHLIESLGNLVSSGAGSNLKVWVDGVLQINLTSSVACPSPYPQLIGYFGVVNAPHLAAIDYCAACGASTTGRIGAVGAVQTDTTVKSIVVTPSSSTIAVAGTATFTATAYNAEGTALSGQTFSWSSSATGIATVNSSGVATGVTAGSANITASIGSVVSPAATLTVTASTTVTSIVVTPASPSVAIGGTQQMTATAYNAQGGVVTGVTFTWASSVPSVGTVGVSSGLLTGVAAGTTVINASSGSVVSTGVTATVTVNNTVSSVTVTIAGIGVQPTRTVQATAVAKNAQGVVITGQTVTWASQATGTLTVNSSGLITGVAAGSTSITATVNGVQGSLSVTCFATPQTMNDFSAGSLGVFGTDTTFNYLCSLQNTGTNKLNGNYEITRPVPANGGAGQINYVIAAGTSLLNYAMYYRMGSTWAPTTDGPAEIIQLRQGGYGNQLGVLSLYGTGLQWAWQYLDTAAGAVYSTSGFSTAAWPNDNGHVIELGVSIGGNPLTVTVWVDGVVVLSASDAVTTTFVIGIASFGQQVSSPCAAKTDYVDAIGVNTNGQRVGCLY